MKKRVFNWKTNLAIFLSMTLLNFALIFPCGLVLLLSDSPKKGFGISDAWFWIFMTPAMIVNECGWHEMAEALRWVNPFIYGLASWLAWRMLKLFRNSPDKDS